MKQRLLTCTFYEFILIRIVDEVPNEYNGHGAELIGRYYKKKH